MKTAVYDVEAFKADFGTYNTSTGGTLRLTVRNRMVYQFMAEIEEAYARVEQSLTSGRAAMNITGDFVELGLAAATTLGRGERTKTVLGSLLTGVTGLDLSLDKNLFQQLTTEAIVSAMRAGRNRIKTRIVQRLAEDDTTYPWAAARGDLVELLAAGSVRYGVQRLNETSSAEAQSAAVDLNIVMVAAVTPADRAAAAQLNAAIEKAFREKDFTKLVPFLQGMGSTVGAATPPEKLEAEVRNLRKSVETDPVRRKKYFDEARKAGLID